jgi:hypothetical protein
VNSVLKLVLALALLAGLAGVAAILWLWPAGGTLALEPERPAGKALESPRDPAVQTQDPLGSEGSDGERSSVPNEAQGAPAAATPATGKPEVELEALARVVDEQLRPIPNAFLRFDEDRGPRSRKQRAPGTVANDAQRAPVARSGADGVVTLRWKARSFDYGRRFIAGAEGYASVFPRATPKSGEPTQLGDLVLKPGGRVSGRVLDKEQRPIAGAQVVVADEHEVWGANDLEQLRSRGPSLWTGAPQSTSGDDGCFLVEGVVAGMTRAWALKEGSRWSVSEPIEVPARGELRDVLLLIDAEEQGDPLLADIEGVVVGPDGQPIAEARMQVRQAEQNGSWSSGATAESDGRFRVHPQKRGLKISIEFSDPQERYTSVKLEDLKPGTKNLVVALEEPRTVLLGVRDERGPLENFRVRWGSSEQGIDADVDKDEAHPDGRALLRVPTLGTFWYEVRAPAHKPEKLGPLEGAKLPAELAAKLETIPGVHGRVLAGEKPVAGAKVALVEAPQDAQIEMNGFPTLLQTHAEVQSRSGTDGSFALDLTRDGTFALLVEAEGWARAQWGPGALQARSGMQDILIQLDAGGTLEGKVLMPPGRSPAGVVVGVNRGDAHPFTQTVGPDGAFRFERLSAGPWELLRAEEMFHGPSSTYTNSGDDTKPFELRRDFTITVGQTTRADLDLRAAQPCVLEIQLANNSQPARAWTVVAQPNGKRSSTSAPPSGTTDSSGHLRLEVEEPGDAELTITPPAESGSGYKLRVTVALRRGPNDWSQDIRTGRVEGTLAGWNPDAGTQWRLKHSGSVHGYCTLRPDSAGHFAEAFVGTGTVEALRWGGPESTNWETVKSFELAAGETKTVQLP